MNVLLSKVARLHVRIKDPGWQKQAFYLSVFTFTVVGNNFNKMLNNCVLLMLAVDSAALWTRKGLNRGRMN